MLKVWRGKGRLFAECDACGSYGTPHSVQIKTKLDPEIAAALEAHTAHMMTARANYTRAAAAIALQVKTGKLSRQEGTTKIRDLSNVHVAEVRLAAASLPNPEGKVKELATACPWCGKEEEVEVEHLEEGVSEPAFSLAAKVDEARKATKGGTR